MNRNSTLFALIAVLMLMTSACNKTEDLTPADALTGKWIIQSSEILGVAVPGDGSYLVFNACTDTDCTGEDFEASNGTSGAFTFELSTDATTIAISDSTNDGGNYDGSWDILELTETDFRIVGNTLFGSLKMEMIKD